jgi:hypothetical protein
MHFLFTIELISCKNFTPAPPNLGSTQNIIQMPDISATIYMWLRTPRPEARKAQRNRLSGGAALPALR